MYPKSISVIGRRNPGMSIDLYLGFWIYILAWHAEWCSGLYCITIGSLLVSLSLLMGTTKGVCL